MSTKHEAVTPTAQKLGNKDKATTTKASKSKSSDKKLVAKNLEKAAKETKKEEDSREAKYLYPDDLKTGDEKKEFRRKARATYKRLTGMLSKLKKAKDDEGQKEYRAIQKEWNKFQKETYVTPELQVN